MPKFMDIPREIRDMIYVQALVSDKVLVKEKEETEATPDPRVIPRKSAPTALLQVSRTINNETNVIFYTFNTFQLSLSYSILGKPSIFNSHATLFRRVLVEMFGDATLPWEQTQDIPEWYSTPDLDIGIALVKIWQNQIRALTPMINLQFLELKVLGLLSTGGGLCRCGVLRYMSLEGIAAHYLKPELFASLPSAIQEGPVSRYRGIWVTPGRGYFFLHELRAIHEAWRELDVKFVWGIPRFWLSSTGIWIGHRRYGLDLFYQNSPGSGSSAKLLSPDEDGTIDSKYWTTGRELVKGYIFAISR